MLYSLDSAETLSLAMLVIFILCSHDSLTKFWNSQYWFDRQLEPYLEDCQDMT